MRNVLTIVKKQLKDTLKNKTVLIQFVMFPVLTIIFEHAINIPDITFLPRSKRLFISWLQSPSAVNHGQIMMVRMKHP